MGRIKGHPTDIYTALCHRRVITELNFKSHAQLNQISEEFRSIVVIKWIILKIWVNVVTYAIFGRPITYMVVERCLDRCRGALNNFIVLCSERAMFDCTLYRKPSLVCVYYRPAMENVSLSRYIMIFTPSPVAEIDYGTIPGYFQFCDIIFFIFL